MVEVYLPIKKKGFQINNWGKTGNANHILGYK